MIGLRTHVRRRRVASVNRSLCAIPLYVRRHSAHRTVPHAVCRHGSRTSRSAIRQRRRDALRRERATCSL